MYSLLGRLFFRPYDKVTFIDQPVVELVSGVTAIVFASQPYPLRLLGAFFFGVQFKLNRALHVFTELPSFVIDEALNERLVRAHGSELLLDNFRTYAYRIGLALFPC